MTDLSNSIVFSCVIGVIFSVVSVFLWYLENKGEGTKRVIIERVLRWWTYARRGYSLYFSFFLGFIQFVIVVYTLAITNVPFLKQIFPHLLYFSIAFLLIFIPASVFVGYIDFKKGSVVMDNILATRSNPATWDGMEASILNCEAIKLWIDGKDDEAKERLSEAQEIFKKWRKQK